MVLKLLALQQLVDLKQLEVLKLLEVLKQLAKQQDRQLLRE
jgi:hypothetical protein